MKKSSNKTVTRAETMTRSAAAGATLGAIAPPGPTAKDNAQMSIVIDGAWCDLDLPLFFLGGPDDPGLATSEEGWLFMFSKEENIQEFIKHATDVVRGFTKVGDPGDLLELLQAVKALDAKEVAYDVTPQTHLVRCFWVDDLIDFAQDLLREDDCGTEPVCV